MLVSRQWSGKTLAGHKADRAAVVRAALEEAGIDPDDHDELSIAGTDGRLVVGAARPLPGRRGHLRRGHRRVDHDPPALAAASTRRPRQRAGPPAVRHGEQRARSAIRQRRWRASDMTETVELGRLLLRPEEVAKALGIGRTTVFELIRSGELRSVKIGKSRRIPAEAVREYVDGPGRA